MEWIPRSLQCGCPAAAAPVASRSRFLEEQTKQTRLIWRRYNAVIIESRKGWRHNHSGRMTALSLSSIFILLLHHAGSSQASRRKDRYFPNNLIIIGLTKPKKRKISYRDWKHVSWHRSLALPMLGFRNSLLYWYFIKQHFLFLSGLIATYGG